MSVKQTRGSDLALNCVVSSNDKLNRPVKPRLMVHGHLHHVDYLYCKGIGVLDPVGLQTESKPLRYDFNTAGEIVVFPAVWPGSKVGVVDFQLPEGVEIEDEIFAVLDIKSRGIVAGKVEQGPYCEVICDEDYRLADRLAGRSVYDFVPS